MKKKRIDVPLGGIFEAENGRKFECRKLNGSKEFCGVCDFRFIKSFCEQVECNRSGRADREFVIFKEIK